MPKKLYPEAGSCVLWELFWDSVSFQRLKHAFLAFHGLRLTMTFLGGKIMNNCMLFQSTG